MSPFQNTSCGNPERIFADITWVLSKCQFVQGGTHCQGLRGDEGGVRLQVIAQLLHQAPPNICYKANPLLLSFRAMVLIDSEGVVVAREVSLYTSLMITFLVSCTHSTSRSGCQGGKAIGQQP